MPRPAISKVAKDKTFVTTKTLSPAELFVNRHRNCALKVWEHGDEIGFLAIDDRGGKQNGSRYLDHNVWDVIEFHQEYQPVENYLAADAVIRFEGLAENAITEERVRDLLNTLKEVHMATPKVKKQPTKPLTSSEIRRILGLKGNKPISDGDRAYVGALHVISNNEPTSKAARLIKGDSKVTAKNTARKTASKKTASKKAASKAVKQASTPFKTTAQKQAARKTAAKKAAKPSVKSRGKGQKGSTTRTPDDTKLKVLMDNTRDGTHMKTMMETAAKLKTFTRQQLVDKIKAKLTEPRAKRFVSWAVSHKLIGPAR